MVRTRRLTLLALAAIALCAGGCATAPQLDPRDPEVWRPTQPIHYPQPGTP